MPVMIRGLYRSLLIFVVAMAAIDSHAKWPIDLHDRDGKPTLSPLLKRVTPAVVNISVTGTAATQRNPLLNDPFFRRFFDVPEQAPTRPTQSVGSGVIVDARKGYVLTNHHVIVRADEVTVTLQNQRQVAAKVIGSDERTDVALLQIEADNLQDITFGQSDDLEVGDFVLAIGNPFGLGQTVTSGIVSALGRSGISRENYEDFIQTDASINPGNSGGALVDLDGNLIGINTAIIAPAGGNVGIGFAIPTRIVRAVMDQLVEFGEVSRGRLGVYIQDLTPDLAEALELKIDSGAVVMQVEEGSSAEQAGLEAGDIVTAIDGEPIDGSADLRNRIGVLRVGDEIDIDFLRDGRRKTLSAEILEPDAVALVAGTSFPKLEGAEFRNLDSSHPQFDRVEGVLVAQVATGSPAWRRGLRPEDIVLAVNRQGVSSVDELSSALEDVRSTMALHLLRGSTRIYVVIQ